MPRKKVINRPDLGERLKEVRSQIGLTQAEMAAIAEINSQTVSRYERGDLPSGEYLLFLQERYNVSVDWLFSGIFNQGKLSPEEQTLLAAFQKLEPQSQAMIRAVIQATIERQNDEKG